MFPQGCHQNYTCEHDREHLPRLFTANDSGIEKYDEKYAVKLLLIVPVGPSCDKLQLSL